MTSTACDDQFKPEPDLEEECRKIRMKSRQENKGLKMSEGFFQIECPKCHRIFNPPEVCECGYEHQCGGPREACCIPGCLECGTKAQDVCVWELAEIDCYDFWRSGCGKKFNFNSDDDTPESEGFRFCPFCGKKIEVKK